MECALGERFVRTPSYSEGLSVSVLEAMGVARPVLITTGCNLPEVARYRCGWVVQPTARELETALAEALRLRPDQLDEFGKRGRQLVNERYSWSRIGHAMAAVYRWLLGGPAPSTVTILREGESL